MKIRLLIAAGSDGPIPFEHAGPVVRIGRDPDCELSLQGNAGDLVSRQHARIELNSGGARLTDTGSSNGTFLNGRLLEEPVPLRLGDRIRMGFTGATLTVLELDLDTPAAKKPGRVPRAVLIGIPAVVAAAALVVVAVIALRKPGANEYAQSPSTEAPENLRPPGPGPAAPPVIDTGKTPPLPTPKLPPKATPSEEVKPVGTYIALDNWVSVLLQREGEDHPWAVLRPESRVSTAQTLVSLPGYRSLIALDNGVNLTLWGNLPEFSASPPVLESVVMLHVPADGTDLDFTLDRGRVVITNRTSPAGKARVRLRFLREVWELELPDDGSEVAFDLWGLPQWETVAGGRAAPLTWLSLVTKGGVVVKTPGETLELRDNSRVTWLNRGAAKLDRENLPGLPAWWVQSPDSAAKPVQKALRSLIEWRILLDGPNPGAEGKKSRPDNTEPLVARIKKQVQDVKDPDNQDVGVLFLAALDEVEPLLELVGERDKPNVRGVALFALQSWLARGGRHAEDLKRILVRRRNGEDEAELIVRLLHFYPPDALGERKTYMDLVDQLDHGNLLVRDLSFWQLDQLGVGGRLPPEARKIEYDPTWDVTERQPAVAQWKKLLTDGKLPRR